MSTIFNSPSTVGACALASTSTLIAPGGGNEKSTFQACDFATFKSFSNGNGCGVDGANAEAGEAIDLTSLTSISNNLEGKHNDKPQEIGEVGREKSTSDKIKDNAFLIDIKSEII